MIKYKYIGGWKEKGTFFTEGQEYEVESKDRKGNITLKDDSFDEYGEGCQVGKDDLIAYFEEVVI